MGGCGVRVVLRLLALVKARACGAPLPTPIPLCMHGIAAPAGSGLMKSLREHRRVRVESLGQSLAASATSAAGAHPRSSNSSSPPPQLHLIVQYYHDKDPERQVAVDRCLRMNLGNRSKFHTVHVLSEKRLDLSLFARSSEARARTPNNRCPLYICYSREIPRERNIPLQI